MAPPAPDCSVSGPPGVCIDAATAADLPALVRLLGLLFVQEAEFHPDPGRQLRALRALLERPQEAFVRVLRIDGAVAGVVSVQFVVSTAEGGRAGLLEDLVVDPAWRGRGLGSALLADAIGQARERGCLRLTLLTDAGNERARAFYLRHGFHASPMQPLRLPLGAQAPMAPGA